jgi:hypothetical protein
VSEYKIPDPKTRPVDCLVLSYKTLKEVEFDDRAWDKVHWARAAKAAKLLLEICGSLRSADTCMVEVSGKLREKGLDWTLETITRFAHDWLKQKRGGSGGNASRQRFFDAVTRQKSAGEAETLRKAGSNGSILDRFRNMPGVRDQVGNGDAGPGNANGDALGKVQGDEA